MHWSNGFEGGGMMIFWWVLIIVILFGFFQYFKTQKTEPSKKESAFDILKKRYTNGEIGKSEFEEKKKDINN